MIPTQINPIQAQKINPCFIIKNHLLPSSFFQSYTIQSLSILGNSNLIVTFLAHKASLNSFSTNFNHASLRAVLTVSTQTLILATLFSSLVASTIIFNPPTMTKGIAYHFF
jgi:hypothetical protein